MVTNIVFVIVVALVGGTFALDTNFSPVLMFKHKENTKTYPKGIVSSTTPINQREFEQRINEFDPNQKIIFLVTDDLSPEDLSIKNEHHQRGFQYLSTQMDIVEYIPYVENAVDNKLTMSKDVTRTKLSTTNELVPSPNPSARIIIVSLPECGETESRFHCVAHIDRAAYAMSQSDEYKDALFVLTSEMNSHLHEVHRRRARDVPITSSGHVWSTANVLLHYNNLVEHTKKKDTNITIENITANLVEPGKIIELDFTGTYPIKMRFTLNDEQYWSLDQKNSKIQGEPINLIISVPEEFSYSCTKGVYLKLAKTDKSDTSPDGVFFTDFQLQLNFTNTGDKLAKFSDSWDCVGFTSPAIWSGLFITFLLLIIVSLGITSIMDIRTMDRFDDPKGKTITVSTTD